MDEIYDNVTKTELMDQLLAHSLYDPSDLFISDLYYSNTISKCFEFTTKPNPALASIDILIEYIMSIPSTVPLVTALT